MDLKIDFECTECQKIFPLELDHVIPQLDGGDNGYRNIVATCHRCNTHKQGKGVEDYLRQLYRKNLLSESELEDRRSALEALRNG